MTRVMQRISDDKSHAENQKVKEMTGSLLAWGSREDAQGGNNWTKI